MHKSCGHIYITRLLRYKHLAGHVAQLTQSISQLALKPGDEEIKKKGWWQFWKKG